MLAKPSEIADKDIPQGRILTEEEDREMLDLPVSPASTRLSPLP